jgi:cytochrome c oxidase cbb3-type subunit I/II
MLSGRRALAALVTLCILPFATATLGKNKSQAGNEKNGKALYQRYCIGCHGPSGDGQGENAPYVDPKPRDFTMGLFKCRSTPSGSIPLDSDLFETIKRGVDTSAMPSWAPLTDHERADLVAYVKTFSKRFQTEQADPPVEIPAETPTTPISVQRGGELYQNLKCWECHGQTGRGDGPSAPTLVDSKGNRIPPYDFTSATRFKCGDSDRDLYRIFMTGLDGTPMPAYVAWLKPEQAWDLVHYLRSLQPQSKFKIKLSKTDLKASATGGER